MPTVSVIVPNYCHAPYLEQRIESILQQTFQDFELILLDDCSTDGSREILERYRNHPKVSGIFYNERNSGSPFKQWKKGLSKATGDYVWIAESDDFSSPCFLERCVRILDTRPDCSIVFTSSYIVESQLLHMLWVIRIIIDSRHGAQLVESFYQHTDRKSTRLNSSHSGQSRMPSSA